MKTLLNKKVAIILLSLWHGMFLFAQDALIKGRVTHGNEPLPNATVSIGKLTVGTNTNGEFSFPVKAGKYKLLITYVGYEEMEDTITIESGRTKYLNYALMPIEQQGDDVTIYSQVGAKRSNFNTPVNVVSISQKTLFQTGQPVLVQMLGATVPSINITARHQTWDPITFRGLNPDQSLFLIDRGRIHPRSSIVVPQVLTGQLGPGSVTNDLYLIPIPAIEKIEILNDGASAQFGSDAIGAVVNIQLRNSEGTSVTLHTGQHYEGDGENIDLGFYHGLRIFGRGFLALSGNYQYRARTFRGNRYEGPVYFDDRILDSIRIAERGFDRSVVPPGYETLNLHNAAFLVKGGVPIKKNTELSWTGAFQYRYPSYPTSYRLPKNKQQVNLELFPDGFLARSYSPVLDISFKAGANGTTKNNWYWDASSSLGKNEISLETHNNNNASQEFSMGKYAQTSFMCGGTSFLQFLNNLHFSKRVVRPGRAMEVFNIALGAEWRREQYEIKPGETVSWQNYDPTFQKQAGVQASSFSETDAIKASRNVVSAYGDIETEINDHFLVDAAARFEYYSDYGTSLAGKLAARYRFSNKFSLRGSISNNFRAPPLQQAFYSSTQRGWSESGGIRVPAVTGIFRNNHDVVASGFGVKPLEPEKAINISTGIASFISSHFNFTIDAYWIQIRDRIVFSHRFDKSSAAVNQILKDYPGIDGVIFTCNAVNTRTIGGDVVINSKWDLFKGKLAFTLAANFNRTSVFGIIQAAENLPADPLHKNILFNRGDIGRLEKLQPSSKIILTASYKIKKWEFTMINRRFGCTEYIHDSLIARDEFFSPKIVTDVNVKISPRNWYSITIGCNNIFSVTPDPVKNPANTNDGKAPYGSQYLPFSPNGGYYFLNMSFNL